MGKDMELAQLRALVATLDHGSFVAAAREVSLPASSLRSRVEALEKVVGSPLLVRTNRGVHATAVGESLLERARSLLDQADGIMEGVLQDVQEPLGEVRVRLPSGPPTIAIQLILGRIFHHYPDLRVCVETRDNTLADISNSVDVIVHFGALVDRGHFVTAVFRTTQLRLMATSAYLAQHGRPKDLADLKDHRLFLWTPQGCDPEGLPVLGGDSLPVRPAFTSADASLVHAATASGWGIGWLAEALAGPGSGPFGEMDLLLPEVVEQLQVRVLVPMRAASMARCRAVVEVLQSLSTAPG